MVKKHQTHLFTDLPYTSYNIGRWEARKTLGFIGVSCGRGRSGGRFGSVGREGKAAPLLAGGLHEKSRTKIRHHVNRGTGSEKKEVSKNQKKEFVKSRRNIFY